MKYSEFFNKEFVLFSQASVTRAIPVRSVSKKTSYQPFMRARDKKITLCGAYAVYLRGAGSHGRIQAVAAEGAVRLLQAQPQDRDQGGTAGRVRHDAACCMRRLVVCCWICEVAK